MTDNRRLCKVVGPRSMVHNYRSADAEHCNLPLQGSAAMNHTDGWEFPLPRTHTGILQGNGLMGVMIWGEGNVLRVTVNRADHWDHRGGMPWVDDMSYANIRRLLEAEDEKGLRTMFERGEVRPGQPERPSLLPCGRLEIVLQSGVRLTTGHLDMQTGRVLVRAAGPDGEHEIAFDLSMTKPLLHIAYPASMPAPAVRAVPAWEFVGEYLRSISFEEPWLFEGTNLSGWVQARPADPPLCLGYRAGGQGLWLAVVYGDDEASARAAVSALVDDAAQQGRDVLFEDTAAWWARYWETVPRLQMPNERLDFLYRYGMYKFAGLTSPDGGVPAGLQGAWIEEYKMPPWQGDYHFNINVQMCYWPAYRGNLLSHLGPLFEMIGSWMPQLRENARVFVGIDDGLMLPHAVDDRCTCMGGFWSGSVDHGCTAWVAEMMYRTYLYSGDVAFLRETAYPFMVGAMRVYEEMLERKGDGWVLPASVSPEYRGSAMDAWGRNASFQLACIHYLCESLIAAAEVLGQVPRPIWREIQRGLPRAALHGPEGQEQIALWEGTPLEESHRHHSHLAGICPFDVLDVDDPDWQTIYETSLRTWIYKGMGLWSGWCVPWASMIHTRFSNADMAELLLEIWERVYTNEGHGTLHDCNFPGFTLMGAPSITTGARPSERMQMDAGMGVTAAIMDVMLHTRRGVNHLFAGAPRRWKRVSFTGMLTEGAFLVGAERIDGVVTRVDVHSKAGGCFRLANPWADRATVVWAPDRQEAMRGAVLEIAMDPGQAIAIVPVRNTP
jgi:alpha-L-fucosidase 2